jgi:sugar-specific transcriptional regulator TrmB
MDTSTLKEAGLTEGEIKVYLALLERGLSTSGPIIETSGIARSIIYQILDKLMQKGLVSCITKEKTRYFQASDPQKIVEYIDERERKLLENKKKVEKMLPQLFLQQKMSPKSVANFYVGFKGIRTAHEHSYQKLKKGEEYVYLGVPAYQPEEQHLYWQRDHIRRAKIGITTRMLFNKGTDKKIIANRNSFRLCEAREMNAEIKSPACFMVYKDTTLIVMQHPESFAVEIVNQQVADSFMAYFEYFWKNAKKS